MAGTIIYSYPWPTAFGRYNYLTGVNCPSIMKGDISENLRDIVK